VSWGEGMAVWHLSGMGLHPGAITMPLTYIYLALKCAAKGNLKAKQFFETSGEKWQEKKGAPENIVIFTSREVITGKQDGGKWDKWERISIRDKWFNTRKRENAPKTIVKYLSNLFSHLKDESFSEFYDGRWIKDIYFVEVNYEDFDDCYLKVGTTMYALRDKEVWVNMIGGSNQINLSLLIAGSFFAVPSRYYYIFQSQIDLLHPEIDKPNFKNPKDVIDKLNEKWCEIPIFQLGLGELINELINKFNREKISVREIEEILERRGYSRQYLAKLRGRIININGDVVTKGPLLERIRNMMAKIENQKVNNVSKWLDWCKSKNILWKCDFNGKLTKLS